MPVTRTFLFTDIEGSTRAEQRQPVAWANNHKTHDQIVEEIVRANNGKYISTREMATRPHS